MKLRLRNQTIGHRARFGNVVRTLAILSVCALICGGCQKPDKTDDGQAAGPSQSSLQTSQADDEGFELASEPLPPPMPLPKGEKAHWLTVEKVTTGTDGGWATGSFDSNRNKIDVTTDDVDQFSIDMTRIPVDWDRIVIIGIDGINSELKHRNYDIYHFARDSSGQWVVTNP